MDSLFLCCLLLSIFFSLDRFFDLMKAIHIFFIPNRDQKQKPLQICKGTFIFSIKFLMK